MRYSCFALFLALSATMVTRLPAAVEGEIIPETTAQRHGLTRPWMLQTQMDRGHGRVLHVLLYDGIIYIQTDRAMIHAIDAETGQSLWAKMIGRPDHPSMRCNAYRDLLGTVNGSRLYVCNRYTGDVLYETQVDGAPGGGPSLSSKRAYVPMVSGMILAYRLEPLVDPLKELGKIENKEMSDEEKKAAEKAAEEERRQNIRIRQDYVPPMACQSAGRALVQPLVTMQSVAEEFVAWPTDRGYLNVARIDRRAEDVMTIKYRLQTGEAITSAPTYLAPDPKVVGDSGTIYTASRDGYVYAVLEKNGDLLWKFSTAEPMVESPTVIEDRVFACTQLGGMYCLEAKTGKQLWWSPQILRFLAASKQRVYAADRLGRVAILDGKTGGRVDTLPAELLPVKVTNSQTDRLYLCNETGLVQCLHETELTKPILYGEDRKFKDDDVPKAALKKKENGDPDDDGGGEKAAKPKPAAKDHPAAAPREKAAPKEKAPPREKAPPKERVVKAKKGRAGAAGADVGADAGGDMGDAPAAGGKAAKGRAKAARGAGKAKGKQPAGGDAPVGGGDNPFG